MIDIYIFLSDTASYKLLCAICYFDKERKFQSFPPQYSICLERFLKMKTYKKTFNCQSLSHPRLCSLSYIFTFYIVIILMLQKLSRIKFLESCHWNCSAQIKIFVKKKKRTWPIKLIFKHNLCFCLLSSTAKFGFNRCIMLGVIKG